MTIQEIARLTGLGTARYCDLESFDEELTTNASLKRINDICKVLHISPRALFTVEPSQAGASVTLEEIPGRIKEKLAKERTSIQEFEERVGYSIVESLDNSTLIWDWNIECLQSVCKELQLDWVAVLP